MALHPMFEGQPIVKPKLSVSHFEKIYFLFVFKEASDMDFFKI